MNENDNLTSDFDELVLPSTTWNIDFTNNIVTHKITDLEAVRQAAILILATERYEHLIYSDNYGAELINLLGENMHYAMSEIQRRVKEALMQDDRILKVDNFEFFRTKRELHAKCTVTSDFGSFEAETEVAL